MYNCPNCGAPITGPKCEYCGTIFGHRLTQSESLTMILDEIDSALLTPNEVRELMGLPRLSMRRERNEYV